MSTTQDYRLFVASAPGIEQLLCTELTGLGLTGQALPGGVELQTDLDGVYRVLLGCGLGLRALLRLPAFTATRFNQLKRGLCDLPLADLIPTGATLAVRVTTKKSRLYHSGAVAQRVQEALAVSMQTRPAQAVERAPSPESGESVHQDLEGQAQSSADVQLYVRMDNDQCTVSLDLCGSPMQRRGYRKQTAKAPLREDLARALLLTAGYRADQALVDPLCGAGTLPIEADLLARGAAPGALRSFAVHRWPLHEAGLWQRTLDAIQAVSSTVQAFGPIAGSDRDMGAVTAAQANAARAGADTRIAFACQALSAVQLPEAPNGGLIVANPPYGRRIGDASKLAGLYRALGNLRRSAPRGYRLALVTSSPKLAAATGVRLRSALMTDLGGLKVRLYVERDSQ